MNKKNLIIIISVVVLVSISVVYFLLSSKNELPSEIRINQKTSENISNGNNDKCVITVRGDKYDVTEFRNKHKGGNIFKCGEDMTDAFNKQHGDKQFRDLQKYKVN